VLCDPAILAENVYSMEKTRVMLYMLSSMKFLIGKDNTQIYRGARVKQTTTTTVKCISANSRYLNPIII
jgi:hypothetical protein